MVLCVVARTVTHPAYPDQLSHPASTLRQPPIPTQMTRHSTAFYRAFCAPPPSPNNTLTYAHTYTQTIETIHDNWSVSYVKQLQFLIVVSTIKLILIASAHFSLATQFSHICLFNLICIYQVFLLIYTYNFVFI